MSDSTFEWIKIFGTFLGGGFIGAVYTNWRTDKRNKIQPISKRLSVSYVNLPEIMKGYSAIITLKSTKDSPPEPHHFEQLAIIQLELTNTGNRDIPKFDFGLNVPDRDKIMGVQTKADDRYHKISCAPEITINNTSNQLDFVLEPFNRKDRYSFTLVVNTKNKDLQDNISLSKSLPVSFVDADIIRDATIEMLSNTLGILPVFSPIFVIINSTIRRIFRLKR